MTTILKSLPRDARRAAAEKLIGHDIILTIGVDQGVIPGQVLTVGRMTNGYRTDALVLKHQIDDVGVVIIPLSTVRTVAVMDE